VYISNIRILTRALTRRLLHGRHCLDTDIFTWTIDGRRMFDVDYCWCLNTFTSLRSAKKSTHRWTSVIKHHILCIMLFVVTRWSMQLKTYFIKHNMSIDTYVFSLLNVLLTCFDTLHVHMSVDSPGCVTQWQNTLLLMSFIKFIPFVFTVFCDSIHAKYWRFRG